MCEGLLVLAFTMLDGTTKYTLQPVPNNIVAKRMVNNYQYQAKRGKFLRGGVIEVKMHEYQSMKAVPCDGFD